MRIKACLTFLAMSITLTTAPTVFAAKPAPFVATYTLHYDDLRIGLMTRTLAYTGNSHGTFTSQSHLTGLAAMFRKDKVEERSEWRFTQNRFTPVAYTYSRSGGDREKQVTHDFDWQKKQVTMVTNDGEKTLPIEDAELQDKLLYQLSLMSLPRDADAYRFDITDGLQIKNYVFEFQDEEEINTPLGKIETRKYERKHDKESKRSTVVWCAPSMNNLPVRVDIIDAKGHFTSIILRSFTESE